MEAHIKQQINILLLQLDSDGYQNRQDAISTLVGLKAHSVAQLKQAASDSPNIRIRYGAKQALKTIANNN